MPPTRSNRFSSERAEDLRLQRQRQIADLVEKQRAVVRHLEFPRFARDGAGEGPFLVTEQLRLEQVLGNGCAVDGDEGRVAARAEHVQRPGEQLLAGPALAFDEHGRISRGRSLQRREHFPQRGVVAHEQRRAASHRQFFLEQQILGHDAPLVQRSGDEQQQMVGIDRLGKKVERALFHCRDGIFDAAVSGHDDHRHLGVDFLRRPKHTEPVANW